jgi:hypothetical protein
MTPQQFETTVRAAVMMRLDLDCLAGGLRRPT